MDLFLLILYGAINFAMLLYYLIQKGDFYKMPFWIGLISLGWFYPQAIGGYFNESEFPDHAYAYGMLFAFLCNLGLWIGWIFSYRKPLNTGSWLAVSFDEKRLYYVGALLCIFGFFFQWKIWSLPEEILAMTEWSGVTVKLLFFSGVYKYGFLILWLLYLKRGKWLSPHYLIFLIPCFLMFLEAAILRGRRAAMMEITAYVVVSFWFLRRCVVPRCLLFVGFSCGLILINSIGLYRTIMKDNTLDLSKRIEIAISADYIGENKTQLESSGAEFENYVYQRAVVGDLLTFDYGSIHWNLLIFNYVPARLVGETVKDSLFLPVPDRREEVNTKYGYTWKYGSTATGYEDSFSSFGWLGFVKFIFIGLISGVLYRHAMAGHILGTILYVKFLNVAMHTITHDTHGFLLRDWVYFFMVVFPFIYWAKAKSKGAV